MLTSEFILPKTKECDGTQREIFCNEKNTLITIPVNYYYFIIIIIFISRLFNINIINNINTITLLIYLISYSTII